jgi:hypothetical protein
MAKDRDDLDDRDDDRPRRRRDDDYDDRPKEQLGPLDKTFRDTNIVVLVLFSICCNGIALILGIIGLVTAKDPKAKSNAMIVTIIGGIVTVAGTGVRFSGILNR